MILYNPKDWFSLIFRFHKSDTFRRMAWVMIVVGLYTAMLAFLELEYFGLFKTGLGLLYQLLGFVISLLLVFRTNTAYDRWWEGRKQWGALVNATRNLALKSLSSLKESEERSEFIRLIQAYPDVLRFHLRNAKHPNWSEANHQPNAVAAKLNTLLQHFYSSQQISGEQLILLDRELAEFTDITGACERIKNSPIPFSYNIFIKKFIFVYVMTMPLAFIPDYGYATIPVVVFVLYVLGSLELIAEEIEDPFGEDSNDLPLDSLSDTISKNLDELQSF
ncbi:MAG: hypothetical protein EP332_03635 [Bacteroidetes bacterium]|nr:MAG: hypothetical protein EP332_03635 [Bacteroidota bacterium]